MNCIQILQITIPIEEVSGNHECMKQQVLSLKVGCMNPLHAFI